MIASWYHYDAIMILSWCYHHTIIILSWWYHDTNHDAIMILSWCYHDTNHDAIMILSWCYHDATMMLSWFVLLQSLLHVYYIVFNYYIMLKIIIDQIIIWIQWFTYLTDSAKDNGDMLSENKGLWNNIYIYLYTYPICLNHMLIYIFKLRSSYEVILYFCEIIIHDNCILIIVF